MPPFVARRFGLVQARSCHARGRRPADTVTVSQPSANLFPWVSFVRSVFLASVRPTARPRLSAEGEKRSLLTFFFLKFCNLKTRALLLSTTTPHTQP